MRDDVGNVMIAIQHIGIAGMFVQITLWLVEGDLRKRSPVDRLDKLAAAKPAIFQVLGPSRGTRRHGGEVVERLMVILEIRNRDRVLSVQCRLPSAGIPRPADA